MHESHNGAQAEKIINNLKTDFRIVGKHRVHAWYAWAIVGIVFGMALAIVYVANRSGGVSEVEAHLLLNQQKQAQYATTNSYPNLAPTLREFLANSGASAVSVEKTELLSARTTDSLILKPYTTVLVNSPALFDQFVSLVSELLDYEEPVELKISTVDGVKGLMLFGGQPNPTYAEYFPEFFTLTTDQLINNDTLATVSSRHCNCDLEGLSWKLVCERELDFSQGDHDSPYDGKKVAIVKYAANNGSGAGAYMSSDPDDPNIVIIKTGSGLPEDGPKKDPFKTAATCDTDNECLNEKSEGKCRDALTGGPKPEDFGLSNAQASDYACKAVAVSVARTDDPNKLDPTGKTGNFCQPVKPIAKKK